MFTPTTTPTRGACNAEITPSIFCPWPLALGACLGHLPAQGSSAPAASRIFPALPSGGLFLEDLSPAAQLNALRAIRAALPRDPDSLVSAVFTSTLARFGITRVSTYWSTESTPDSLNPSVPTWLRFSGRVDGPSITAPLRDAWWAAHRDPHRPGFVTPTTTKLFGIEFHVEISPDADAQVAFDISWHGSEIDALAARIEAELSYGRHIRGFLGNVAHLVRYEVEKTRSLIASGQGELAFILCHRIVFDAAGNPLNLPR